VELLGNKNGAHKRGMSTIFQSLMNCNAGTGHGKDDEEVTGYIPLWLINDYLFPHDDKPFRAEKFDLKNLIMKLNSVIRWGLMPTDEKNHYSKQQVRTMMVNQMEAKINLGVGDYEMSMSAYACGLQDKGYKRMIKNIAEQLAVTDYEINKLLLREFQMLIERIHTYMHRQVDQQVDRNNWEINYLVDEIKVKNAENIRISGMLPPRVVRKTKGAALDFVATNAIMESKKHEKDLMVSFFLVLTGIVCD
jgi:hypothetical protein